MSRGIPAFAGLLVIVLASTAHAQAFRVHYRCGEPSSTSNQIKPQVIILNDGNEAVALSRLTLRYYYTKEGTAPESFWVDWAAVGAENVTHRFGDGWVEVGFTAGAGSIAGNGTSGELDLRFAKDDWSDYDQTNDPSFDPSHTAFADTDRIDLFLDGTRVAGEGVACTPGDERCAADGSAVELCDPNGDWVVEQTCAAGEECSGGGCAPVPPPADCEPGVLRCSSDGGAVEECDATGDRWETSELCAAGSTCESGSCVEAPDTPTDDDWLHVDGNVIEDAQGNAVRLTGIAWFGYETGMRYFHGLYSADWKESLDLMGRLGFNLLRVPISVAVVRDWIADPSGGAPASGINFSNGMNAELQGKNNLQILDLVIAHCKAIGMKVMFDMHSTAPDDYTYNLWYKDGYPFSDLVSAWQFLADRYRNDDTVVAMDLKNEPHGKPYAEGDSAAIWDGSTAPNNWRKAAGQLAQAILAVNPNLLIVVEGVEGTPKPGGTYASTNAADYDLDWWGGNLRAAGDFPVQMPAGSEDKLVYSAHEYGPSVFSQPWFYGGPCATTGGTPGVDCFDETSLYEDDWRPNWYYLVDEGLAPVLVGEWGGPASGDTYQYLLDFADFLATRNLHHTFWCFNPNSGDTGGIVLDDWKTVDEQKLAIVAPTLWSFQGKHVGLDHATPLGSAQTGITVTTYYQDGGTPPLPADQPPAACTPGGLRCNGSTVESCAADGSAWEPVEQCGQDEQCSLGACVPVSVCEPGTRRCDGSAVESCKADGSGWEMVDPCDAGQRCSQGVCESGGPCIPGGRRCVGSAVMVCSEAGSGWSLERTCAPAQRCWAGTCLTPPWRPTPRPHRAPVP